MTVIVNRSSQEQELPEILDLEYVILVPGDSFNMEFLHSWSATLSYLYSLGKKFCFFFARSSVVSDVRNTLLSSSQFVRYEHTPESLKSAEVFDGKIICKKVIMIDSDMVWTIDDFKKLIESPHDVTVGVYAFKDNYKVSVRKLNEPLFLTKEELSRETEPFPVSNSGLGFTCVSFEALKSLKFPWFYVTEHALAIDNKMVQRLQGEDFNFFQNLLAAGYIPMADPSIKVGHTKPLTLYPY
jgi:hypothetical protein